jgi:pilus assembly protein Flp/PilA
MCGSEVSEMTLQDIKASVLQFVRDEDGLTTVEYAVAGSLVAAAVVLAFTELGTQVGVVIDGITTDIGGTPTG